MPRPRRRAAWFRTVHRVWQQIPPATHGCWAVARLGILGAVLYANATNFDATEGRTLLVMSLLEAAGFKRRA